jgi:hypothetical protein
VRRSPLWVAALLGIGLWPLTGNLTSYYFSGFCAYALLYASRPTVPIALCLLNALGWFAAGAGSDMTLLLARQRTDETFFWISLATVAFVWLATALVALGGTPRQWGAASPD